MKNKKVTFELDQLFKNPKRAVGVNAPHFVENSVENGVHQADLLFLPNDDGYKYLLVVTDIATRKTDTEPLKSKDSKEVLKGILSIYKRKILDEPKTLELDDGSEFKSVFAEYFKKHGINIIVKRAGRHKMQALVERKNQKIGKELFKLMLARELLTGETNREWIEDLPDVLKDINKNSRKVKPLKLGDPVCKGSDCILIPEGTRVRVKLDNPIDIVSGSKLHGRFRSADVKWEPFIRTVTHQLLKPDLPPLYMVSGINNASYNKNELQIVNPNEQEPDASVLRKKPNTYIVKKILEKKKIKGKIFYLVQWKGFNDPKDHTWEAKTSLLQQVPAIVKAYEESLN